MDGNCIAMLADDVKNACAKVDKAVSHISTQGNYCDEPTLALLRDAHATLVLSSNALRNMARYHITVSKRK